MQGERRKTKISEQPLFFAYHGGSPYKTALLTAWENSRFPLTTGASFLGDSGHVRSFLWLKGGGNFQSLHLFDILPLWRGIVA